MSKWYSDFRILASRIERFVGVKSAQFVEISCATLEINKGEKSQRCSVVPGVIEVSKMGMPLN